MYSKCQEKLFFYLWVKGNSGQCQNLKWAPSLITLMFLLGLMYGIPEQHNLT